jgi:hypothetical protein
MSEETIRRLKIIAEIADEADGKKDDKIQRSSLDKLEGIVASSDRFTSFEKVMLKADTTLENAIELYAAKVPKDAKTFNLPTDKEIRDIVAKVESPPPKPPCQETWLGGWFSAPSWLPDAMKTKVCPKR